MDKGGARIDCLLFDETFVKIHVSIGNGRCAKDGKSRGIVSGKDDLRINQLIKCVCGYGLAIKDKLMNLNRA